MRQACKKLIADGVLVKITPSTFKFAQGYFNSKGLNPQSSNGGGQSRLSFNGITELANQSILDHNKKVHHNLMRIFVVTPDDVYNWTLSLTPDMSCCFFYNRCVKKW